jgi:hypothetical protein
MLEHPVKLLLLPNRSNNVKVMDNQQGGIMIDLNKHDIKKDDLERLFKELGSVHKISERLSVSSSTIYYYFNKYNINIDRRRFPYTKEELIELHKKYGSITKVASAISRSYTTVRHWYNSLDIIFNPSGMTVFKEIRETPMSQTHKSIVVGSMLGDGGIWLAPHSRNARLYVCHCEKQLGYLNWIHGLLMPFSRPITQTEKAGPKIFGDTLINGTNFFRFYTIAHPDITEVYKTYYRNNFKYVDTSIINNIDLLSMSIWFADDGSIQRNNIGEPQSCSISTNSFSYKEQLILVEALRRFFDGKIRIKEQGGHYKGIKREDFVISMSGKEEINKFLDMIKLILPECIHYKLS